MKEALNKIKDTFHFENIIFIVDIERVISLLL